MRSLEVPQYVTDAEVRARHRRAVLRQIIAPVAITAAILILVMAIMVLAFSPRQFGVVASFMSLLILVPSVAVCLVPYIALVALFAVTRKAYFWMPGWLRTARHAAHQSDVVAHRLSRAVTRPIIAVSQRLAWIERLASGNQNGSVIPTDRK